MRRSRCRAARAPRRSSSSRGDHVARGGDRDIDRGGADFVDRLALGLRDPLLGHALAALQSDCSRSRAACAAMRSASARAWATIASASAAASRCFSLIVGEQLLGLLAQSARLVELGADARRRAASSAPVIEAGSPASRPGRRRSRPRSGPRIRRRREMLHHAARPRQAARRPPRPASRGIGRGAGQLFDDARPTSTAMPRTSASACSLVAAMRRSAAAICAASGRQGALALGRVGGEPLGGFLERRLRLGAGLGERLLIGRARRLGLGL